MSKNILKAIYDLIEPFKNSIIEDNRNSNSQLTLETDNPEFTNILSDLDLNVDKISDTKFSIELKVIKETYIFLNFEHFNRKIKEIVDLSNNVVIYNVAILFYEHSFLYFDKNIQMTFIGDELANNNYLIHNSIAYLKFEKYFRNSDFSDDYNLTKREVVIYSSANGILKLNMPVNPVAINDNIDCLTLVNIILDKFSSPDFKTHFKNVLFKIGSTSGLTITESLFNNLKNWLDQANNNHQLQLRNFSFDKFKNDLEKEKDKYFTSIRDIVNKMSTQFISVPISIGASLFASYKVENKQALYFIIIAFIVYYIYSVSVQVYNFLDLLSISRDFKHDITKIIDRSGLNTSDIDVKSNAVKGKILFSKIFLGSFVIILSIMTFLIVWFLCSQLDKIGLPKQVIQNPKLASY